MTRFRLILMFLGFPTQTLFPEFMLISELRAMPTTLKMSAVLMGLISTILLSLEAIGIVYGQAIGLAWAKVTK
jgi:hypothetical protein